MRIAYLLADRGIPVFGDKGASVHVREMIRALAKDNEVDLFCAKRGGARYDLPLHQLHVVSSVSDAGVTQSIDEKRLMTVAGLRELLHRVVPDAGYDLLYERYSLFSDAGAVCAAVTAIPFLLEVNAPLINERQKVEELPLASLARSIERRIFRQADAILAVSTEVAAHVIEVGAAPERVHIVPNGVDTNRFCPATSGERIRRHLGLGSEIVIGFVGSLKPWHGVDRLITAFDHVAKSNWRLLVVGEGPHSEALFEQATRLRRRDQIVFTGAVSHDEIPEYIAAMDIAVAPYQAVRDFYFSPLKLFEYLASGKTVVATDVGQISQVIRHGENGYLVGPEVTSLAEALARLATDPELRRQLGERAPVGVVSWEETARRVLDIGHGVENRNLTV